MAREIIDSIVWANDVATDPANLIKPSDAAIKQGWPQGIPDRQNGNWLWWHLHQNLAYIETNGIYLWDAGIEYDQYAMVRYGTKHYISLQSANENQNPGTETLYWKDYFVWLTEQAGTEQTNQTVANYLQAYQYPHPSFATGTTINLTGDNLLLPDLNIYPLDTNPLTITVPTTVANTWYYVYVDEPAGSDIVSGDVSITTVIPSFDDSVGMFVSGTKRCIGYIEGHNTGNGEAEPYIVSQGWYQRRDEKKRLALYTPSPQVNTTLFAGVPNFDGKGLAEIASFTYESETTAMAYADATGFSGNIADGDLADYVTGPYIFPYNGQVVGGISLATGEDNVSVSGVSNIITDSSGNIIVSGHNLVTAEDEAMAFWLKRFKLPRGIFTI
jgi:hypothetical protein